MQSLFQKLRKCATALMVSSLILGFAYAPASPAFAPKPVEATGWPVIDISTLLQSTISAIADFATEVNTWYLQWKETVGDGIAWTLINMVIEQMIRDTTAWVASGFQGKPVFLEDLSGYLGDMADNIVGAYIWESDTLNFLCSPFQLNVKIALDLQYNGANGAGGYRDYRKAQCSLSGAIGNLDNFMNDGWQNWFEVTMHDENNPIGAFFEAKAGLGATIGNANQSESQTLDFGSGFFSQRDENGSIITPGQTIQTELSNALNVPRERVGVADEINELFGALITQLMRGVLSEVGGGLRGLGSSGGVFESPDYGSTAGGAASSMGRQFTADRAQEQRYITLSNQGISLIDTALARTGGCDASLRQQLVSKRATLAGGVTVAQGHITTIGTYETRINAANISAAEMQQAVQEYMNQARPTFHSTREIAELEAALGVLPTDDKDALTAMAEAGNIRALVKLYEQSCN